MPKAWTENKEYQALSFELATSDDREFERRVLPLVRVLWPLAGIPPALRWLDRSGIDILVWSDSHQFPLVVQCKGFKVPEEEIGKSQIDQCLGSIASFRASGLKADTYLLIHNRTGRNESFRLTIEAEIQKIVESGQVQQAELWDRNKFLRSVFNKMLALVRSAIESNPTEFQFDREARLYAPLEQVPYETSDMVADPNRLVSHSKPVAHLWDPASTILSSNKTNLILMIGEAGYGKTTAVLRALTSTKHLIFYVPAATIPKDVNSTVTLLRRCVNPDQLFDVSIEVDRQIIERLTVPVIKYLFKDESTPVMLILDGLDESIYFSRRGGLQMLFNQLRDIRVPVVLTARKEFWTQRQLDFSNLYGNVGTKDKRQHRRIRLIELLPWQNEQIGLLAGRFRDTLDDADQKMRLSQFIDLINKDQYEDLYGDIPRRPLFLTFILETVAERGVHRTGRAQLFYEWANAKVVRDIRQPLRWGSLGRAPIISKEESADTTVKLSFLAMMIAAFRMTHRRDKVLELLPVCSINEVLLFDEHLRRILDPTGLFLNSLIVPISPSLPHEDIKVHFTHRAYQEFFLALYLREHPDDMKDLILPDNILDLIRDLDNEGLMPSYLS